MIRSSYKVASVPGYQKVVVQKVAVRSLFSFGKKAAASTSTPKIKKIHYEPDFTITPTTYSYQLPLENEPENDIRISASPISMLFEYTGVRTSTSNFEHNLQQFENYPSSSFKKLNEYYAKLMAKKRKIEGSQSKQASQLNFNIEKPRNIKLTSKDFIDDSLYNPYYGYFNKDVEIYHNTKPFDYSNIKSTDHFMEEWAKTYAQYNNRRRGLQLWHTPTELFQPYYGEAIARYILASHSEKNVPLIIYEIGAGNGTLMKNILDYIETHDPEAYKTAEYRVVEISTKLFSKQKKSLSNDFETAVKATSRHKSKIKIINNDIFQWKEVVSDDVYFLAFEVFDNFSHDVLKYNISSHLPYQGYVAIDKNNEFHEFFNPKLDYWCHQYLSLLSQTSYYKKKQNRNFLQKILAPENPSDELVELNELKNYLWPFRNKLSSSSEFIPTKLLEFFFILKNYFPNHNLIATDFDKLPNSIPNTYNGPVVQTLFQKTDPDVDDTVVAVPPKIESGETTKRAKDAQEEAKDFKKRQYKISKISRDKMVNTTTYMVNQGYFDIMFPTNFELVTELYSLVTKKTASFKSHHDFLSRWGDVNKTTCQNGENPMLEFYTNVQFMYTKNNTDIKENKL